MASAEDATLVAQKMLDRFSLPFMVKYPEGGRQKYHLRIKHLCIMGVCCGVSAMTAEFTGSWETSEVLLRNTGRTGAVLQPVWSAWRLS